MVNITIYGLDQFVVGNISKDLTKHIAQIYEISEDDVNFIALDAMVFHKGVEQTSWHVIVHVDAPIRLKALESLAYKVIVFGILGPSIHVEVTFRYYEEDSRHLSINEEYPRYIDDNNSIDTEQDYDENIEEGEEDNQIYTGDIFAGLKK